MSFKNVTIYDIAKYANTSTATVSRVLSNSEYPVSEELRQRVLKAAKDLNYTPNLVGRQLKTKEITDIAVIIPNISNPFYPSIVLGVEDVAREKGYNVLLCDSFRNPKLESEYLKSMLQKQVKGVIISSISQNTNTLLDLVEKGLKIVAFDQNVIFPCNKITFDFEEGAFLAVEHLIKLGHRKIAFLGAPINRPSRKGLYAGYMRALNKYNISINKEFVLLNELEKEFHNEIYEHKNGIELAKRFIKLKDKPTGAFAINDLTAIGFIHGLKTFGIKVPRDISVVGFDNIFFSEMVEPPLTTIEQPKYEMGRLAADLLFKNLAEENNSFSEICLKPSLVIRNSTHEI